MIWLYWTMALAGVVGDVVALYFAFHSRRHERENTVLLKRLIYMTEEIGAIR